MLTVRESLSAVPVRPQPLLEGGDRGAGASVCLLVGCITGSHGNTADTDAVVGLWRAQVALEG